MRIPEDKIKAKSKTMKKYNDLKLTILDIQDIKVFQSKLNDFKLKFCKSQYKEKD